MYVPILATKLYIPASRSKIVLRPRLIERLNEGLARGCKLTLISAAAGFGKTTLVSEWVAAGERDREPKIGEQPPFRTIAWLSLDEGDKDPTRFLTYLVAALQSLAIETDGPSKPGGAGIGVGALAMLQSPQPPPTETILTALLNDIILISGSFILVLDDYHLVDSKSVDEAITFLIEHSPPHMHVVITTREDPHLPLARYRARGQLTELRAADLRFTPAEAAEFLNRVMGLNLSDGDIAALKARTEGWIAGLQLAAISMQGHQDTSSFIKAFTGSHHFVLDYLLEEVLHQQPESIQAFLLRSSILERMCGSLCEAIFPDSQGQKILERLERANLFIVPLDHERRWYRYHHLFADLLRQRSGQSLSAGEINTLHISASQWYEQNGLMLDALHHALTAGAFERAARLAEDVWQSMDRTFQIAAWLGWVRKIPSEVINARPTLCAQLGSAFSDIGDLESSEVYLQKAERALAGRIDQEASMSLPGTIALVRANNAQNHGDLAETVKYAEQAIRLTPKEDTFLLAQAFITLGFTHWATGNLKESLQAMHTWMEDMGRLGNEVYVIASAFAVADMQVILGRLREAEKILREGIRQAAALGPEAENVTAHHHLGLALLAYERGDDAAMTQHLKIAADRGERTTLVDWRYRWSLAHARLKEAACEWDAALDLLDEARRVYIKNPVPLLQPIEAREARVYLKQGRLDMAQAWVRERGVSLEDEVRFLVEYEHLTLAQVRLAEGSFEGANVLLERMLALAETQKRTGSVIEILLTQALVDQAQGNQLSALRPLERALRLAQPEGYLRTFVDHGEAMHRLLVDFRSTKEQRPTDPLRGYTDKIQAAFSTAVSSPLDTANSQSTVSGKVPEIIEPLTDRELEILRLIADGRSNMEISQLLYLALSTVKGHNLRIFAKLQVQNRTEAVARARAQGLL